MREDSIFQKIVVLSLGAIAICYASLRRAFQWKGNPGEVVGDAPGGSGTACTPASRQTGAGTAGDTVVGGRDADEGDDETVPAAADFAAVVSSLLMMNEDDVFRKIVMLLWLPEDHGASRSVACLRATAALC